MSDWTEWKGGNCPVAWPTLVEVKLRYGGINKGQAVRFCWAHGLGPFAYECDDDIVAYRITKES